MLRSLLQTWLQNAARAKLRDAAVGGRGGNSLQRHRAARRRTQALPPGCGLCAGDRGGLLRGPAPGAVTIRGHGFRLREGGLHGRRVVLILSGPGRANARRAAEVLIDGHRPGLSSRPDSPAGCRRNSGRNDILLADRLLDISGKLIDVPAGLSAAAVRPGIHRGPLLTADHVVRSPAEKQLLLDRSAAVRSTWRPSPWPKSAEGGRFPLRRFA